MAQTNRKLTKSSCARLKFDPAGPAKQIHSDKLLPAFGIRCYRGGRKSYVLRYGSTRSIVTLGQCTTGEDVEKMRKLAHDLLTDYKTNGIDPQDALKRSETHSVESLVTDFIAARSDSWSAGEKKRAEGRLKLHIKPHIGKVGLTALTRRQCREMHAKATKKARYEANRAIELLHAAYEWALSEGLARASDLAEGENPAKRIRKNPEKHRKEWIHPDELPNVVKAIRAVENPWMRGFFLMALHTGARKGELLGLKWENVDLKAKAITFRDTKNHEDHVLPLNPDAVELLRKLPRTLGNEYVFCGRKEGKAIDNPYKVWKGILKSAGIERRVTIHDIRRTVGSTLATAGYSTQKIGKLLNHKSEITAKVYAEIADESKRQMADTMAGLLK